MLTRIYIRRRIFDLENYKNLGRDFTPNISVHPIKLAIIFAAWNRYRDLNLVANDSLTFGTSIRRNRFEFKFSRNRSTRYSIERFVKAIYFLIIILLSSCKIFIDTLRDRRSRPNRRTLTILDCQRRAMNAMNSDTRRGIPDRAVVAEW